MITVPNVEPSLAEFKKKYNQGLNQLVYTKLIADLETPVSAFLKICDNEQNCFLFESVNGGESRGRYSIIGLNPDLIWKSGNGISSVTEGSITENSKDSPINHLREVIKRSKIEIPDNLPPMATGLFGYMGYDMVRFMEELPEPKIAKLDIPDSIFIRPRIMVIFDSVADVIFIVTPVFSDSDDASSSNSANDAYEAACKRISDIYDRLMKQLMGYQAHNTMKTNEVKFTSNMKREQFHEMVLKAKDYIAAGDIFQVVLSQRFEADFYLPPFSLYRALRHLNPSPFLFYLKFGEFSLVGSSPEILVRVRNGKVTVRPIAGTRKRGANHEEDLALEQDLLSDEKELAEHMMLLDLGRNDAGRAAKVGTVKVTERMIVERYSHVMHIVSNVEADIRDDIDALDALSYGFPAGTVSGAPKIRAMEIINELEPVRREFYAGTVGYIGSQGALDTCITLRTALIKDNRVYVQAGGGIVADSDPEAEFQESCNKAKAIMAAVAAAEKFV